MTARADGLAATDALGVIILAAGQGTRLRSALPKPLHRVAGRPLIDHVLRAAAALSPAETVVVTGHGADALREHLAAPADPALAARAGHGQLREVVQVAQRGTADAVAVGLTGLSDAITTVVVLYADTPLVTGESLQKLVAAQADPGVYLALVTCQAPDPTGYGRILRAADGRLIGNVEERAATPAQRSIHEINAGFYAFAASWLRRMLPRVEASPSGEYQLPDLLAMAVAEAQPDQPWPVASIAAAIDEALGINNRVQLAEATQLMRQRINRRLMLAGVTLIDPATTYIDDDVIIGQDTIVYPGTTITGPSTVGGDCRIGPHAIIDRCQIGDRCRVVASMLEQCAMQADSDVGPYSHLRPGTRLGQHVHVGNFAEVKNAQVGDHTAIGHVSYIGDATLGERVNVGAGTITANYSFYERTKELTTIGNDVYLGCDTILISPVSMGDRSATGAGSVVNKDIGADVLAVGLPARAIKRLPQPESDGRRST